MPNTGQKVQVFKFVEPLRIYTQTSENYFGGWRTNQHAGGVLRHLYRDIFPRKKKRVTAAVAT